MNPAGPESFVSTWAAEALGHVGTSGARVSLFLPGFRCAALPVPGHLLCSPDRPHLDLVLNQPQRLPSGNQHSFISCRRKGACCWKVCLRLPVLCCFFLSGSAASCSSERVCCVVLCCVLGAEGSWVSFLVPCGKPCWYLLWFSCLPYMKIKGGLPANCVAPDSLNTNPWHLLLLHIGVWNFQWLSATLYVLTL